MGVVGPGLVNDPANKSLRFDILKFGLERFCSEMTNRGTPLKLDDDLPIMGRFFAQGCQSQVIDQEHRKSFIVRFSGRGYAWTNVTGRLGFTTNGVVEYAPDFQMYDGAMYIYFRPKMVDATAFEVTLVESALARTAVAVTSVNADELGRKVVSSQLRRGFTVIREDSSGAMDFGLGYVETGQKPFKPFTVVRSDKVSLANDRTEVRTGQQDLIGGFEVEDENQALYLTMSVDGTPSVDVFVIPKVLAQGWIDQYVTSAGPKPLMGPPRFGEALPAGQRWQRTVPVAPGVYYLLIDHSPVLGQSQPSQPLLDSPGKVDYLVQLGEAP